MRQGLIFKAKALEDNHHPRSILHHMVEEVSPEGMAAMALVHVVATRLVDVVVATHPKGPGTNFLRAKFVERPTTRSSSVSSILIPHTWVKRRMQMRQCPMVLIPIGMQIRVQQIM
jgi:tartrate dehydratase alpha subunit/fumarate hydratase class I-like protein